MTFCIFASPPSSSGSSPLRRRRFCWAAWAYWEKFPPDWSRSPRSLERAWGRVVNCHSYNPALSPYASLRKRKIEIPGPWTGQPPSEKRNPADNFVTLAQIGVVQSFPYLKYRLKISRLIVTRYIDGTIYLWRWGDMSMGEPELLIMNRQIYLPSRKSSSRVGALPGLSRLGLKILRSWLCLAAAR